MGSQMGKGGKQRESAAESALAVAANEALATSRPVRNEVFAQTLEALQTGGVGAQLPIIQQSVEASRAATSSAMRQIDEQLAGTGLGRSPFGQQLRSDALMQGELATNAIPTSIAQQFIGAAPGLALGGVGMGLGGLGTAGGLANQRFQINAQRDIAKGNQQAQYISAIGSLAAAGACWIAEALYGSLSPNVGYARLWLFREWRSPVQPAVAWAYLKFGRALATRPWFVRLVRPFFTWAVRRGYEAAWKTA